MTVRTIALFVIVASASVSAQDARALFSSRTGAVGIHFWFEAPDSVRSSEARAGARLVIESNAAGFLTVWSLGSDGGVELTPMQNRWSGYRLTPGEPFILPEIPDSRDPARRLLILFARAQMEQVATAADARAKIARLTADKGRDGQPAIVRLIAIDGQFVVHRDGAQPGVELEVK